VKIVLALGAVVALGLVTLFFLDRAGIPITPHDRAVNKLVAQNIAARGGEEAWRAVSSLRLTGQMDIGQGMHVPYVLDQKRPDKMCLEFVFDGETAIQCADGKTGWKIAPFRGRKRPEPMTELELRETADSADLYGLLFDYAARGNELELLGHEPVHGKDAVKLKVTLPQGAVRWLYLDPETGLELKLEAMRPIAGTEKLVETFFYDWQPTDGLLIAHRQETRTVGDEQAHFLTVESVRVNPPIDDARFAMPPADPASAALGASPAGSPTVQTTAPRAFGSEAVDPNGTLDVFQSAQDSRKRPAILGTVVSSLILVLS
jgi:hypothetical protein